MNNDDTELIIKLLAGDSAAWTRFESGDYAGLIYWSMQLPFESKKNKSPELKELFDVQLSRVETKELHRDILFSIVKDNYRKLTLFEGRYGCRLKSYIRNIVVRMTIDYLRKRKKEKKVRFNEAIHSDGDQLEEVGSLNHGEDDSFSASKEMDDLNVQEGVLTEKSLSFYDGDTHNLQKQVEKALAKLSPEDREFVQVSFLSEISSKEGAKKLGIAVGAYDMRKKRIKERLREIIRNNNEEDC